MLGTAAAPKSDRGGAIAVYDIGAAAPDGRGGGQAGAGSRVYERRNGGVLGGCKAQFLFSGSEHPSAGGASGYRSSYRVRLRQTAIARGGRRTAAHHARRGEAPRSCHGMPHLCGRRSEEVV